MSPTREYTLHVPGQYVVVEQNWLQDLGDKAHAAQHRPVHDDIDRARFAAELLRDRLEVLVAYGPDALEAEMGTDRARALTAVLDELQHDDSEWNLVRMAL